MLKVKKLTLLLITGFVWSAVSILLIRKALRWYPEFADFEAILSLIGASVLGFIKTYFIFIKVTRKNIERIMNMKRPKLYFFEMHTLKLYLLILSMIATGAVLRNIEAVPKYTLFPVYAGVGLAMLYAAAMYYIFYFKTYKKKHKSRVFF